MKIVKVSNTPFELSTTLGSLEGGKVFRFAYLSFTEALKEDAFYLKVKSPEVKDGVLVVNLADGTQLKRDYEHRVVVHDATIGLKENT